MHNCGHEHHVFLPHDLPHAMYTLIQSRHVIPQHLQSCTLEHKMHLILRAGPTQSARPLCSINAIAPAQAHCKVMAPSFEQRQLPDCFVRYWQSESRAPEWQNIKPWGNGRGYCFALPPALATSPTRRRFPAHTLLEAHRSAQRSAETCRCACQIERYNRALSA